VSAPLPSDDDMIAVPRSLLGAAAYCARHHAGADSKTYKALSELAMSPAPAAFAGHNVSDLARSNWHPGDET
jgi:hypothetical protein